MIFYFVLFLVTFLILCKKNVHFEFANDKNIFVNVFNFYKWFYKISISDNETRITLYDEFGQLFPKFAHIKIFGYENFFTQDPEIMRKIYLAQNACERSFSHLFQMPFSLLTQEYIEWRKARKELNPAFSTNVLKGFFPVFESEVTKIVAHLEENFINGQEFDVTDPITQLVFCTSATTIFSLHDKLDLSHKMTKPIETLQSIIMRRLINPLMQNEFLFKWLFPLSAKKFVEIRDSIYKMADDALKESFNNRSLERVDENDNIDRKRKKVEFLIDIMINNGNFNEEEIKQQIGFMMVATSDTSITFLSSCLIFLAIHQNYQNQVYEEIQKVFIDENVEPTPENLHKLTFLKQCMDESLRLFSPVPHSLRKVAFGELDLGIKKKIQKDAPIHILTYLAHMDEKIWGEDVREFRPERFSAENCEKRHQYAFSPFGQGPRICIGYKYAILSAKIELMRLLRAFKFHTKMRMEDIKMSHVVSAKFTKPPKVWIEKRMT